MRERSYVLVTAVLFGLVGLLHLLRVLFAVPVELGAGFVLPFWISWVGAPIALALCAWGFRIGKPDGRG